MNAAAVLTRPDGAVAQLLAAPTSAPEKALPLGEEGRLALLRRLQILDTLPEQVYDDIVTLASTICGTPIGLVSLVDRERQWFKARRGLDVSQTGREVSFCAHAITWPETVFVVEDARADPRFRDNPLVTGAPGIRFYAGATIRLAGGEALGTVCVIDTRPQRLDAAQHAALEALARQAAALLGGRLEQQATVRQAEALRQLSESAGAERRRSAELLDMVLRGGTLGLWELDVPSGRFSANAREYEIVGRAPEAGGAPLDWRALVHPDDWPTLNAAILPHLKGETDSYGCEHRLGHAEGHWIWVQSRAVIVERQPDGAPLRIVGTHMDVSARVQSLEALRHASALLQRMGGMARIGGWELELATGRITWTDEVYRIHDLEPSVDPQLVEALSYYPLPGRNTLENALQRAISDGEAYDLELPFITAKGRRLQVRCQGEAVRVDGATVRLVGAFQDITAQKAIETAAIESRRRLRLITDHVPALIAYVDTDERYRFLNAATEQLYGTDAGRALGRTVREVRGAATYDIIQPCIARALRGEKVEFAYTDESLGRPRRLQATYIPDADAEGKVRGFYVMTIDISDMHEVQRRLEALARVDALTGLPNRRQLDERIDEAMLRTRRSGRALAVLFLDVDRFKSINDTVGHAGGDAVLREFAQRLRRCVRATDTVARVAGDEFVVLAEGAGEARDVATLGQKIVDCMRMPFALDDRSLQVTTSVGIAIWHGDESTAPDLLARADAALYTAKHNGRDGFVIAAI